MKKSTLSIFGLRFPVLTYQGIKSELLTRIKEGKKTFCVPVNLDLLRMATSQPIFYKALRSADCCLADGMPLVWLSRLTSKTLPQRVPGCDLVYDLCCDSGKEGYNIFFLGAGPGVALKAKQIIQNRYPDARIVGVCSPSREILENDEATQDIIRQINSVQTDILFVALGAPRQEIWIAKHLDALEVKIAFPCGGSIDFIAGVQKKAPKWIGRIGFEWLYRLAADPKRLFRRYILEDIPFSLRLITFYVTKRCSLEALLSTEIHF